MQTASYRSTVSSFLTAPSFFGHEQSRVPTSSLGARKQSFAGRVSYGAGTKKSTKSHRGNSVIVLAQAHQSSANNAPRRLVSLNAPSERYSRRSAVVDPNAVLDNKATKQAKEKNGSSNIVGKGPLEMAKKSVVSPATSEDSSLKGVAKINFIGPDKKGMMAAASQLMFGSGCNILSSAQYVNEDGIFFQRMSIDYSNAYCGCDNREILESTIEHFVGGGCITVLKAF